MYHHSRGHCDCHLIYMYTKIARLWRDLRLIAEAQASERPLGLPEAKARLVGPLGLAPAYRAKKRLIYPDEILAETAEVTEYE